MSNCFNTVYISFSSQEPFTIDGRAHLFRDSRHEAFSLTLGLQDFFSLPILFPGRFDVSQGCCCCSRVLPLYDMSFLCFLYFQTGRSSRLVMSWEKVFFPAALPAYWILFRRRISIWGMRRIYGVRHTFKKTFARVFEGCRSHASHSMAFCGMGMQLDWNSIWVLLWWWGHWRALAWVSLVDWDDGEGKTMLGERAWDFNMCHLSCAFIDRLARYSVESYRIRKRKRERIETLEKLSLLSIKTTSSLNFLAVILEMCHKPKSEC